ncbi:Latent-transforming growth factor beta-binding protein 2 [Larimichthys crocea]|uniref:Uncharacterized protein n=1 Tax=Larimichthys crocea TaxID=215358 RepID=A0ACD3QME0_LARCR|nr:Latent-transforming growth factor beta-binding protein 2 [Larimichthys crocea]
MAALLMKHVEKEKKKLLTVTSTSTSSSSATPSSSVKSSVRTFHTQKGQYTVHFNEPTAPADGQTANAAGGGGGGVDRIQVMFTPTICKMRCSQERCVKYCERGNMTTLYSSNEGDAAARTDVSHGPGFRVFLCPLLCKNGGVCLQKDRCLCPPNFTGKFCQIPVAANAVAAAAPPSSTNEIVKPALPSTNQDLTQSEFLLPLGLDQEAARSGGGASGPSMVKVRVQHPPEASVKIHQVLKVSGFSPTLRTLSSSSSSGSAGAPAPGGGPVQAQTLRGDGTYNQQAGFKYCFREVKDRQQQQEMFGCMNSPVNKPNFKLQLNENRRSLSIGNRRCAPLIFRARLADFAEFSIEFMKLVVGAQSVISEEKSQCYRVLGSGQGPSSCSLPILRNITKQICCCSRVGKAWGPNCQRCPYFGSVAFKEICPAGPGYHYSASALQFNQRVTEQLGNQGASLVPHGNQDNQGAGTSSSSGASRSQDKPSSSGATAGGASTSGVGSSAGSAGTHTRPSPPQPVPRPQPQPVPRPQPQPVPRPQPQPVPRPQPQPVPRPQPQPVPRPQPQPVPRPQPQPVPRPQPQPVPRPQPQPQPQLPPQPQPRPQPPSQPRPQPPSRPDSPSSRPVHPGSTGTAVTQDKPQTPGRHGTQQNQLDLAPAHPRPQPPSTGTQDIDECQQNPCSNGRCDNTPGSYRCVCRLGYRVSGNTCTDVDECEDPLQCPGQECINSQGSYRCVSCQPGYRLSNRLCTDIDECRQAPCTNARCENTPGSYRCVCRHGYKLQNNTCTDIDECASAGACEAERVCVNTVGSFRCDCRPGYRAPSLGRQCRVCGSQCCENTIGSYRCLASCEPVYRESPSRSGQDVDECANSTICGEHATCQNLIGRYLCVCHQGFTSTADGKACEDEDECVSMPGVCGSARCENVEGSFMCECDRRGDEFDPSIRRCVNTARQGGALDSSSSHVSVGESPPVMPPLPAARPGELRECYYNLAERGTCSLLATNTSQQECCCTVGEGWGLGCQYHTCPATYTAEFQSLCPSGRGYVTTGPGAFSYTDVDECKRFHPEVCKNGVCVNNIPGYNCYCSSGYVYNSTLLECVGPPYFPPYTSESFPDDYSPAGDDRSGFRGRGPVTFSLPDASPPRSPSFRLPPDPRAERAFGARPLPPSRPYDGPLTLPGAPYLDQEEEEEEEVAFRPGPPFPPFTERSRGGGGGAPRRVYERRYESYAGLSTAEDCGILHGCENGRCIRVAEGYTCDCYQGYGLDMTSMTCIDKNECEDGVGVEYPCVNARCVNTEGSFRCVCRRGYVMSRRPNHCVAA